MSWSLIFIIMVPMMGFAALVYGITGIIRDIIDEKKEKSRKELNN